MSTTNAATIQALAGARDATLRASLAILVNSYGADIDDLIHTLSEVIDDHAMAHALRTGDYDYASHLSLVATHLAGLDKFIENYDGAPQE